MSFVIILCLILGLIAGGLTALLARRRAWLSIAVGVIAAAGALVWLLTPVCVAIPDEDLADFDPPIDTRTETGMIGQRYFQQRSGTWYQCKVRIARELFF